MPLTKVTPDVFLEKFLHVYDEKISGINGGSATSGSWETRTLNTTGTNTISGASLGSNQITLPAGTYYIESSAPSSNTTNHKTRLYDTTGAEVLLIGTAENSASGVVTHSSIRGRFTISVQSVLELQHRVSLTNAGDGYGIATGFSVERYTDVRIWQIS